ncbi:extracellular solute-binding protein [Qingshengfaniella alkalisoli]|uniref:extracellular solute-binding protein n=1 Tax=Qingshengfaniella alkalisoli TaxID=2599296 RepID=UPI00143CC77A|nr:extracellular solute-binding protein [Qingshengfaniella alkalisoli]
MAGVLTAAIMLMPVNAAAQENIIKSHGIATYGDLKYPADFEHLDYVNPDAPKGGEISIWADGTFDSLNPYTTKGRAGALGNIFFESLLEGTADETGSYYGLLAESLEYPESQDWVIFNIRPEARFSDGTPVTAEDVKFSHDLFIEQGLPSYREAVKQLVKEAVVLDERRVQFIFQDDVPRKNLILQVGGTPVFSKKWFEETGSKLDETRLEPAVGSSPYLLESVDVNRRIVYKRNPDYWGWDLPINQGRHNYDRIRVEYFADSNAAFEAFKRGEYTFRIESEAEANTWTQSYNFSAVRQRHVIKEELPDGNIPAALGFVFNMRRDVFKDPKVREALGLMYNFEWSNKTLFQGLYARQDSFWEGSQLEAKGPPTEGELELLEPLAADLPDGILTEDAVTFPENDPGVALPSRRVMRQALGLLADAGWEAGQDGKLRNAEGETLQFEIMGRNPLLDRVVNPYVENLKQLGVDVTYNRIDPSQYTFRRRAFDFDMVIYPYTMGPEPGIGLGQPFGSEDADHSVFNPAGVANPAIDTLIETIVDAQTREDLVPSVRALDRSLRAMHFWVPMWYKDKYWVAYFDMYEHPETLPKYALGYLDFWWWNEEKARKLRDEGAL